MFLYKWLPLATILIVATWAETLKFSNNRYESLLVAIGPRVKPDPDIIRELISMLRQGSQYLHRATRERAYIGSVKILVPDTWQPDPSWSAAVGETFEEADIRVDHENPIYMTDPYTFQPGHCGEPGHYIHLTPGYLTDRHNDRDANYGNMGRTLVHEFAHLRYGVFDEYGLGTPDYPEVYLEDSTLNPTGCTATLDQGEYIGNCSVDPITNLPGESCYFRPSRDKNTASASIMYDTTVNKVTHFCESNSDDPDLMHNPLAPNQQNKMCNHRGTWDVIMDHPDFKGDNRPVNKTAKELWPSIEILYKPKESTGPQACGRPVVLVLDVSGSMNSNNRYFKQTQTADKLIRDVLPAGTKVGVVTFSSFAQVVVNMTTIYTSDDRERVANQLPGKEAYNGGTAIGQGLLAAKELLDAARETGNGRIVLITDGMENVQPFVEDVKGEITAAGIRVHSLAYSVNAALEISALSNETGGMYAYYTESPTSSILDSIVERLMTDISVCVQLGRIEIMRRALLVSPGVEVRQYVDIDSTVGNDTIFVITLPHGVNVDVTLIAPSGASYTSGSTESSFDASLNIKRFRFEMAENGTWLCSLRSTGSGSAILVVKSLPTEDPYEVQSWMSSMFSDASYGSKPTVVYVHVHKGYSPVVHADVTVTVERPMASSVTLKPHDDGKFADTMANDGVYSAYFTQYTGNQRYSLDVDVRSTNETGYLTSGAQYGGAKRSQLTVVSLIKCTFYP